MTEDRKPFEDFGIDVFSDDVMRDMLSREQYAAMKRTINEGRELTVDVAESVACAMRSWAMGKGATHFTHWFQPMTGSTAEKHDSFLEIENIAKKPLVSFSGKSLMRGEADGSSFPSGGLRATFEARGYTAWDCTSPAFVKKNAEGSICLCIPTAFCAFSGEALDEKTPLLRSMEALSKQAVRVLHLLGETGVSRVTPTVGGEQEYFLVDRRHFLERKDLVYTGRTLFGSAPAKGQEMSDQYYAATPERIAEFMGELDETLWRLGVPAKTEHNEVAPAQYELAPLYASANVAVDHNQIVMEQMRKIAERHGLVCLLHEKPFMNVNGSGKHDNWSLLTDNGKNLLKPGKNLSQQRIFLTFIAAVIAAVDEYAPALRYACATLGNEHRLGGHEAPPSVISVFTGARILDELTALGYEPHEKEHMRIGVSTLPVLYKDDSDRNRTSPFAFTGDKFEFRMVGSSQSLGFPNTVLNTIVAEELAKIADALENSGDNKEAWKKTINTLMREHGKVIFNGNNYSAEWINEAKRRGLPIISDSVDALSRMCDENIVNVFTKHGVLCKSELMARSDVAFMNYATLAHIEASTTVKMARQKIMPSSMRFAGKIAESANSLKNIGIACNAQSKLLNKLTKHIDALDEAIDALDKAISDMSDITDAYLQARYSHDVLLSKMNAVRCEADELERVVDKKYWPMPSYGEILFHIV